MKNALILFLFISPFISNAQSSWEDGDWENGAVGFGCSYRGHSTILVKDMRRLLLRKKFDRIRKKLESKQPGERFLAAFILEKLEQKKQLNLDEFEIEKIKEIKNSEKRVPVCAGCTYWERVPLNELMNKKHMIYIFAESWFKYHYKKHYKRKKIIAD